MTVRLFVVDDHPFFRDGVRIAMSSEPSVKVVGEAATGAEAIRALAQSPNEVDVVLLDLQLPDQSGIDVTRAVTRQTVPGVTPSRVLILSMLEDDDAVVAAVRAGAMGYVVKSAPRRELLRAIHVVAAGGAVFSPVVAARLSAYFSEMHRVPSRAAFPDLTERERDVLDLIARGYTNRQIARELVLSEKTIRNHVTRTFAKLHVNDRTAAAVRARDAGLGG